MKKSEIIEYTMFAIAWILAVVLMGVGVKIMKHQRHKQQIDLISQTTHEL
jgi:hypothetical protein